MFNRCRSIARNELYSGHCHICRNDPAANGLSRTDEWSAQLPDWNVDVAINNDIGFKLNKSTGSYELVADEQTWDLDVPVQRFIDQVTQQYARMTIHNTVKDLGYQVEEEWEMDDLSIEITATVWE